MKAQGCRDSFLALSAASAAPLLGSSAVKPWLKKVKQKRAGKESNQRGVPITKLPFKHLSGEARGGYLVFVLKDDWRGLAPEI